MNATVIDPGWAGLGLASLMMVAITAAAFVAGINMIRDNLIASARATVQLVVVGLILGSVFALDRWYAVIAVLALMTAVAGFTAGRRIDTAIARLGPLFTLILAAVTALTLLWVTQAAVGVDSLDARYFIPLGGMILGNAMNAGTLAAGRYVDELRQDRERVAAALSLGASPAQATRDAVRRAFVAALTPTINTMLVVGIVKLPGIMTGQMLGGAEPFVAAKYQLVVLFRIMFGDGATALLILLSVRRLAFTAAWQPRL